MWIAVPYLMATISLRCTILYTVALQTCRLPATSRTGSKSLCCPSQVAVGPGSPDPGSKLAANAVVSGGAGWDGSTDPGIRILNECEVAKQCNHLLVAVEHPASRVLLVTGDVNLQNKADAAMPDTADTL
jgi:hypothetical protein